MPRGPSRQHFTFVSEISEAVRQELRRGERRKGFIKKLYHNLQQDQPEKMPTLGDKNGYTDFYQFVVQTERHLEWEKAQTPPVVPTVTATAVSPPAPEAPISAADDEISVMAEAAHGLIKLAVTRKNHAVLELALEVLGDLLKPTPVKSSS